MQGLIVDRTRLVLVSGKLAIKKKFEQKNVEHPHFNQAGGGDMTWWLERKRIKRFRVQSQSFFTPSRY